MRQRDWTPLVLLTATACVTLVGLVWVTTPWLRGAFPWDRPGPHQARHLPPAEIAVWAGEFAPGVKGLLGPVWGDPDADRFHDHGLNENLSLVGDARLGWYRLLLFNTSTEERTVRIADGALTIEVAGSDVPVRLRSLSSMLARGEVRIPEGRRTVFEALGALGESVRLPPGNMVSLVVPFAEGVDLGTARAVATADGAELHRRPMARAELQALLYEPDVERVKDL